MQQDIHELCDEVPLHELLEGIETSPKSAQSHMKVGLGEAPDIQKNEAEAEILLEYRDGERPKSLPPS